MKEQYKELKEDVLDEQKAIDETIERLLEIKENFHPQRPKGHGLASNSQSQRQDYLTEPAIRLCHNRHSEPEGRRISFVLPTSDKILHFVQNDINRGCDTV